MKRIEEIRVKRQNQFILNRYVSENNTCKLIMKKCYIITYWGGAQMQCNTHLGIIRIDTRLS